MSAHKRLYRKIFDEISTLIDSGDFPAGTRLPTERELAEQFQVSRPTIREATIALEATNRVMVKSGSGVYVLEPKRQVKPNNDDISPFELVEARVLFEGEAAALAAKMITNEEITLLKETFNKLKLESGRDEEGKADREFHSIIANATHNTVLANQIHSLWELQENISHIKEAHQAVCSSHDTKRIKDHEDIMLAVVNHDATGARSAMHKHFSNILESMHSALEEEALKAAKLKGSQMRKRFSLGLYASID